MAIRSSLALAVVLALAFASVPVYAGDDVYVLGNAGWSCLAACLAQNRSCNPSIATEDSTALYRALGHNCTNTDTLSDNYAFVEHPAVIATTGQCVGFKSVPGTINCTSSFHSLRRLCRCGRGTAFPVGAQGATCTTTCNGMGATCPETQWIDHEFSTFTAQNISCTSPSDTVNSPNSFNFPNTCCYDQPGFISGSGNPNSGRCIGWRQNYHSVQECGASFSLTRRLCRCTATGAAVVNDCPVGTFISTESSPTRTCTPCPPGTSRNTVNALLCTACASNLYQNNSGQIACLTPTTCNAGQYMVSNFNATHNRVCESCPFGTFSTGTNVASCTTCPFGGFTTVTGATSSAQCTTHTNCTAGFRVNAPATPSSDRTCTACVSGTNFSTTVNAASCTPVTDCGSGFRVNAAPTAASDRTCTACAAGTFSITTNAGTCTLFQNCTIGQFVTNTPSATEDRTCTACAAGTFSTATNAATCTLHQNCTAGQRVNVEPTSSSDRTCTACLAGTFSNSINAATCTGCPANQYQPDSGQTSCLTGTPCNPGTVPDPELTSTTDRTCATCTVTGTCSSAENTYMNSAMERIRDFLAPYQP